MKIIFVLSTVIVFILNLNLATAGILDVLLEEVDKTLEELSDTGDVKKNKLDKPVANSNKNNICGGSDHLKLLCIQDAESAYDACVQGSNPQECNYEQVFRITSELVNTDGYKVKDGMNAPGSNHDTVNRARIQLGLLYVQGYGVEKNIPKALELWNLILEDWRNAKSLQINNAKHFIAQFETKTVAEVNTEASEGLSTYYFMYKYVKRCNELGDMYIDEQNMKSAKKYIKAIEIGILDHFKANDLDTDSVWKKTTKKFNNEVGGLFDIIEDQPNAPYDTNMAEGCSLYYSRLSSLYKSLTPQQEEEKDF